MAADMAAGNVETVTTVTMTDATAEGNTAVDGMMIAIVREEG
jgi:hypothetical protein